MPINTDWKSMIANMRSQYCSKGETAVSRDMSDGSKISICKKGWSVFFATMRKHGWKETEPHPKTMTQETIAAAIEDGKNEIINWFKEQHPIGGVVGAKKNIMELRSGTSSKEGRVFALSNDTKSKVDPFIIEWFESKYKPKEDDCGCGE